MRPIAEFVALLQRGPADLLADVRSIPRSRTNSWFGADTLTEALVEIAISYRHLPALGDLRYRKRDTNPSPNTFLQAASIAAAPNLRLFIPELTRGSL